MNNATSTIVPAKNFCSCGPEILLLSIIPTQCLLALHHTELDLILEVFEGSWLGVFVWHCALLNGWVQQLFFAQDESRWSPVPLPGAAIL